MKLLKKFWEAIAEERMFLNAAAVFCTFCTLFMLLFVNEEPEFDAIMIFLNGLIVAAVVNREG